METLPTIADIQAKLAPVFSENGVRRAVLFGSFAKGCARPQSDVDIAVETDITGLAYFGLIETVRQALDDRVVDLLAFRCIKPNSRVDEEIKATGVQIYG